MPFFLTLWDWGLKPLRTAGAHRFASNFYDIQARAMLDGDLAVPSGSLGIEGFVVGGRTHMYFPPFPAILRLPILVFTERFDGRLTAPSMVLAWLVLAASTAWLYWSVRVLCRPGEPVRRVESAAAMIFVGAVTGGSVVVYDASLPWVYHEVYLWSTAFAVASLAGVLTLAFSLSGRMVVLTGSAALGAILTRTTSGWAIATTLVVFGALTMRRRRSLRYGMGLVAAGTFAIFVGVAINWSKFHHLYMFTLQHQVWTSQSPRRRLALLLNGGTITGPQFFETALINYFRPNGIRIVPYFPFITLPAAPARAYGGAFLDQTYRTGSISAFMPFLFLSTLWGFVAVFFLRPLRRLFMVLVPTLGALAISGGVMAYGYLAHRYTTEFVPVLTIGAAIGCVDVVRRLEHSGWLVRRVAIGFGAAVALFGSLANTAAGLTSARIAWRGSPLVDYVEMQHRVTGWFGGSLNRLVVQSDELPRAAPTDELHILGDCEALYIGTGDQYQPWVLIENRQYIVEIAVGGQGTTAGVARILTIRGEATRGVTIETSDQNMIRLRIGEGLFYLPTGWINVRPGDRINVALRADTERDRFVLVFGDQAEESLPAGERSDGRDVPSRPRFEIPDAQIQDRLGVRLNQRLGPPLELCNRLLDETR